MLVELVDTWTADGVRLNGALQIADSPPAGSVRADAVLLLSGVGSNFYGSSLMASLASMCNESGIAALRVNTRGHDGVSTASTDDGGRTIGAAYEIVDDCRYDVQAWADFLIGRGFERIAILGHSLGAIKSIYSQAKEPHAAVTTIIAVSPPCLSHERFRSGEKAADFVQSFEHAQQLAAADRADMLFKATFPFPMVMSAGTYLDKYGAQSRYDITTFATELRTDVLFAYGELELMDGGVAFAGLVDEIPRLAWDESPQVVTIPGANHFYSNCHDLLRRTVRRYLTFG